MTNARVSPMPGKPLDGLKDQEIADLLAFIKILGR